MQVRHDVGLAHAEEALGRAVHALDAAEVVHRDDAVLDVVEDGLEPDDALALEPLRHRRRLVRGEAHHGLEAGAVVLVGVVLAADDLDEPAQLHLAGGVGGLQQLLLEQRVDAALAAFRGRRLRLGRCVAESASADFFSITTFPVLFVVTRTPSTKPSHPRECDVMQRC